MELELLADFAIKKACRIWSKTKNEIGQKLSKTELEFNLMGFSWFQTSHNPSMELFHRQEESPTT